MTAPVQYGPGLRAAMVYLFAGQFLSKDRTARAITDLYGIPISHGTVATVLAQAAAGLDEFTTRTTAHLKAAPVVNFDETGLRSQGKTT